MILPDVNLLIHAHNLDSRSHERARTWWDAQLSGTDPVCLAWATLLAFVRLTTNRVVVDAPWRVEEAVQRVEEWLAQPTVRIVRPTSRHAELFFGFLRALGTGGNLTTDAHLAALAVEHGCTLCSTDPDFPGFPACAGGPHLPPTSHRFEADYPSLMAASVGGVSGPVRPGAHAGAVLGKHGAAIEFFLVQHGEKEPGTGDPPLTKTGVEQARWTGAYLRAQGVTRLFSSPLRRARETAEIIGDALGLAVDVDDRLRERMNWGDSPQPQTLDEFLREWQRTATDRDFTPGSGDSSRAAGERFHGLLEALAEQRDGGRLALVTHGGVTVDLLRNLFSDDYLRSSNPDLLDRGVPPCAITHLIRRGGGNRRYELKALTSVAHLR